MKFLAVLLVAAFNMGVSQKSFGQNPASFTEWWEADSACYSLETMRRVLACYTLQTEEACLRKVEFTVGEGEEKMAEFSVVTEINDSVAYARSMLQKFISQFSFYESQGDTQHYGREESIFKTLMEEKVFCSLNLECDGQETEDECKERQNKELDCNVKAVAAAMERFCSDWIPADKVQSRADDPHFRAPTGG